MSHHKPSSASILHSSADVSAKKRLAHTANLIFTLGNLSGGLQHNTGGATAEDTLGLDETHFSCYLTNIEYAYDNDSISYVSQLQKLQAAEFARLRLQLSGSSKLTWLQWAVLLGYCKSERELRVINDTHIAANKKSGHYSWFRHLCSAWYYLSIFAGPSRAGFCIADHNMLKKLVEFGVIFVLQHFIFPLRPKVLPSMRPNYHMPAR